MRLIDAKNLIGKMRKLINDVCRAEGTSRLDVIPYLRTTFIARPVATAS